MTSSPILVILQLVVGLGLLNVWMIRRGASTSYRGGHAQTLRGEFEAYGLPYWMFYVVGGLKVVAGLALIAGIWVPVIVRPAALVVATLMVGAIAMHLKVKDPVKRSLPALAVLVMCLWIARQR
ncbi:DoxX family protein [Gemmatimonas groenlandica]|uniref:DoxX family protein n=1 Tax=Gemmatimonas groenlandica TaxID=2732249 RepID=A0A6M4IT86_9BACT|nr:DoxX family protein [Gemmatimonas groenlandica]QJR36747.1 DoxX family protein [Gemmatimonas groenlandica]